MRSLMLPAATAMVAMAVMAAPAQAQMHSLATVNRLADMMNQVEQLNMRRPRDEFQVNIARQIEMIRNRFNDVQTRRTSTQQALMLADEGLYNIQQYAENGSGQVPPWLTRRMDEIVGEMRGVIANRKGGWHGPPMRGPGYGYQPSPRPYPTNPGPMPPPVYVPPPRQPRDYAPPPPPPGPRPVYTQPRDYVPPPAPAPRRY